MARTPATSRRAAPTKVKKPFPWGTAIGSLVLAAFLGGILFYAATNQGGGQDQVLVNPDEAIEDVAIAEGELSRSHVNGPVDYPQTPPNSGDHSVTPQQCAVYGEPIAPEHAVHSLEHGAVWVTYNDDLSDEDVAALARKVEGDPYGLMSPLPEQSSPINLSAWGRRLSVDSVDDKRIDDFIRGYTAGPQTPEPGAACVGNTTTGPLQESEAPSETIQVPPPSGMPEPAPTT